jgi:hypothetical protein
MRRIIHSLVFLAVLAWPCSAQEAKLTAEAAKKLLPQAAGMSNADAKALGEAEATSPDRIKSKSLSLVLLALDPEIAEKNPAALKEFRYLGAGFPSPDRIAKAMSISKGQGYVSFIQAKYITDCTCESTAERAEGVVTFKNEVYAGRIAFVAHATKAGWVISEFRLPQYKTKVVRGKDGVWTQEALPDK